MNLLIVDDEPLARAELMRMGLALGADVPPNAGSFRRLDVALRENCVVGIPQHPYSCSAATTNLSELTANLVTGAIAELGEGFGMAATGRCQPPSRTQLVMFGLATPVFNAISR